MLHRASQDLFNRWLDLGRSGVWQFVRYVGQKKQSAGSFLSLPCVLEVENIGKKRAMKCESWAFDFPFPSLINLCFLLINKINRVECIQDFFLDSSCYGNPEDSEKRI